MSNIKSLKILEQVEIKSPCHESWELMHGNQEKRHCAQCVHTVTNLSALTKSQAEKILKRRGSERMCVRYEMLGNGAIKFKDSVSVISVLKGLGVFLVTIYTFLGLTSGAIAENSVEPANTAPTQEAPELMGEIADPSPSPSPTPTREIIGDMAVQKPEEVVPAQVTPIKMGKIAAPQK